MSNDSSVTVSTVSRVRQFGLYRNIDVRTEEFLRLSKKRQIKQGCACAAVSTAITVAIVVIILLIYEYVITVEWDSIQNNRSNTTDDMYINDQPIANRLYRSYLGFDQDYYEQMPFLLNALQENSYIDPSLDLIPATKVDHFNHANTRQLTSRNIKSNNIRKTSPRPFYYKTSTTLPFMKTYGSKTWIEKYRNEQRLQNIRQIIKYLEKTINAKVGDMNTRMPDSQGHYPINNEENNKQNMETDYTQQGSMSINSVRSNHYFDPLINFTPDNPAEVNLLADTLLNFSPLPTPIIMQTVTRKPFMFRRISNNNRNCNYNSNCKENTSNEKYLSRKKEDDKFSATTPKSFSVMLNLFPLKSASNTDYRGRMFFRNSQKSLDNIYLTTPRLIVKFKRKSTTPFTRRFMRKKPRMLMQNRITKEDELNNLDASKNTESALNVGTNMIIHVQMYTPDVNTEATTKTATEISTFKYNLTESPALPLTTAPVELSSNQVEDFHVGSSGVIPISDRTTPSFTNTDAVNPLFETTMKPETHRTIPPDIFTFSHEDAKFPDHYLNYHKQEEDITTEMIEKRTEKKVDSDSNRVVEMLVIKLKNSSCNKTTTTESTTKYNKDFEEVSKVWSYVPLTNSHYGSMNPHFMDSHQPSDFDKANERQDDTPVTKPAHIPTYVEIKRNYTNKNTNIH